MWFLIIYFLVQISCFGAVLRHFCLYNFKIFPRRPTVVADIFTQTPPSIPKRKQLPTALCWFYCCLGNMQYKTYTIFSQRKFKARS